MAFKSNIIKSIPDLFSLNFLTKRNCYKAASNINFGFASTGKFIQEPPYLYNPYTTDPLMRPYLKKWMPAKVFDSVDSDLTKFGDRIVSEVHEWGTQCEAHPPKLEQHTSWGHRVDHLITCPEWEAMRQLSAQEGLVALGYERSHTEWSRLHQMSKLFLYGPSSGLYSCPLAMTDGAAKVIENLGMPPLLKTAYQHLTSRDPSQFWTSGQWMTERKGGSDVGHSTETVAVPQADGSHLLYGYKWFSSATDASMALTLARVVDDKGNVTEGSRGLSLFYIETQDISGTLTSGLNGIQIQRLKKKLGTRQLPTAELLLDGAKAHLISEESRGIAAISGMLLITRLHNATSSVGGMRRICQLARDYAGRRIAFGRPIRDHPLHLRTLASMEVECRAGFLLVMEVSRLLGLNDTEKATDEDNNLLRILSPLLKLYTAKQAMSVISEGLEAIGGQGYMEDSGLPVLLRDAQVTTIWEGTTNVLSLDLLRAISRSSGAALASLLNATIDRTTTAASQTPALAESGLALGHAVQRLTQFLPTALERDEEEVTLIARDLAYSLSRVYMGMLLIEYASFPSSTEADIEVAKRWILGQDLTPVISVDSKVGGYSQEAMDADANIVMASYNDQAISRPFY